MTAPPRSLTRRPLSVLRREAETLEVLYARWMAARQEWAAARQRFSEEARRLDEEGDFLMGTLKAARGEAPEGTSDALAAPEAMQQFMASAETRLRDSREALASRKAAAEAEAEAALSAGRDAVRAALERYRTHAPLKLTLLRRSLAGGRAILHLERPSEEGALLLAWILTGRLPTRYGFLFDEATDDLHAAPPTLYAEAGVGEEALRPTPQALLALLARPTPELPLRTMVPMLLPTAGGGAPTLARWRARGAVLELEWAEGEGFRTILSAEEAATAAGTLLRLQLEGRLELELVAG